MNLHALVRKAIKEFPESYTQVENFEPHQWVMHLAISAYLAGYQDGRTLAKIQDGNGPDLA